MSKDLGNATSYAYYVAEGGTKTPQEYGEMLVNIDTVATRAEDAADSAAESATGALNSKNAAQTAATTATTKASEATTAAQTATTKAGEASTSASTATSAKDTAVSASQTATTKASEATTAAATATSAASTATTAKDDAVSAKTAAQTAQTGAETAAASVSASAAQIATNTEDITQLKSEFTALTSDGVVPSTEQILTDKGITDSVPYHYRKTGSDGADRLYDQIVGGTVCWNQLVRNGNFESASNWDTIRAECAVSDNVATITSNSTDAEHYIEQLFTTIAGHIYCVLAKIKTDGSQWVFRTYYDGVSATKSKNYSGTTWLGVGFVINNTVSATNNRVRFITDVENSVVNVTNVCTFDLTKMFGSTIADYIYNLEQSTEGAGVAFFKALFPNDYYEYNAGELVSVSGLSEHKMIWKNLINADSSYSVSADTTWLNTTVRIPRGTYTFSYNPSSMTGAITLRFFGKNGQIIYYNNSIGDSTHCVTFTLAEEAYRITSYSNSAKIISELQIEYGTEATAYEPYKAHSYPLDSTLTLRGMFKLDANNNLYADGDTYDADGMVTRKYGVVDLGTLDWVSENSDVSGLARVDARNLGLAYYSTPVCSKFNGVAPKSYANIGESEICFSNSESFPLIRVKWSELSGKTNAEIISALTGVMFVYELATPTTEEADPYQHLQQCDPNGTEEYVSTGIVPVGHNSFYPENLKAKIDGLPWNFANLIAPTESAFVATRNYVTGDLFIVSNVLYKATSNIANGGTITPSTNCTSTTLAEIISALA